MFGPCKSSLTIAWLAEPIPLNSLLILFEPISGFDRMFIASSISLFSSVSLFECWREQHRLVSNTRERKKRQQQQQPTGCFFFIYTVYFLLSVFHSGCWRCVKSWQLRCEKRIEYKESTGMRTRGLSSWESVGRELERGASHKRERRAVSSAFV